MSKETEFIQKYVAEHKNAFSIDDIKKAWNELNADKEAKKFVGRVFVHENKYDHELTFIFFKQSKWQYIFIFDRVDVTENNITVFEDLEDTFSLDLVRKNYVEITSVSPKELMTLLNSKTDEFNTMVRNYTKTNFKSLYELAESNKRQQANRS